MKNKKNALFALFLAIAIWGVTPHALAYNLRQFTSKDGLSNSAILSLSQTTDGLLWIGTCEGVNLYDGKQLQLYNSTNLKERFSGNLIENMLYTNNHIMWVQTNYGLDRVDVATKQIESFRDIKDRNPMTRNKKNDLFLMKDDGYIYYCLAGEINFQKLSIPQYTPETILAMVVDDSERLWVFSSGSNSSIYQLNYTSDKIITSTNTPINHSFSFKQVFGENNSAYFIDEQNELYEYNLSNGNKYYIAELHDEISKRGEMSTIIRFHDDFFIGFKNSGLICLKYQANQKTKYRVSTIGINSGIFCLMKDKYQDIVWIGTDGQGLYMYTTGGTKIQNTLLENYNISNPVRALYLDEEQTLWVGTKGSGILQFKGYNAEKNSYLATQRITTNNSKISDNSVYCFAESNKPILWIGGEDGISYYSYSERTIKLLTTKNTPRKIKYVHSICELNDSTLWIATVGEGIVKAKIRESKGNIEITKVEHFVIENGKRSSNYFFCSYLENDSTLWFGNRGEGAYRVDIHTNKITPHKFDEIGNNQMFNDIFAISHVGNSFWFGTSLGLIEMKEKHYEVFDKTNSLTNNTIHGILHDQYQNLWLSTNRGVIKVNTENNTIRTYNEHDGMKVVEFSDGAYFLDKRTNVLFWGGVNGFITLKERSKTTVSYMPQLTFNALSLFGKECTISDYLTEINKQKSLTLSHEQSIFALSFSAIDFINGSNYSYYYKIEELSDYWIENGFSSKISFSNLSPGKYHLSVKYRNPITGEENEAQRLTIRIIPPWYLSSIAYTLYFILFVLFISGVSWGIVKRYKKRKEEMIKAISKQKKNDIYESKLRFFINIAHEFTTPLTLINGPCERILSYAKEDKYIQKYAALILQSSHKLNGLIQELIEFRRLDTGHKVLKIQPIEITSVVTEISNSFSEMIESHGIEYIRDLKEDIIWNTDLSCLNKVVSNLLSNAFKYVSQQGVIKLETYIEKNQLHIKISNTGVGIAEKDLSRIFDRFKVLDNLENEEKRASSRNGLGLAICHSMVTLLQGRIHVTSTAYGFTSFEVILPQLASSNNSVSNGVLSMISADINKPIELPKIIPSYDRGKLSVMIIESDQSLLWLIAEIFIQEYNVLPYCSPTEAFILIKKQLPDLIIADSIMDNMNGISFVKRMKADRKTSHIPIILLSSISDENEQIEGIGAGVEAYISKPFRVDYLKKIVMRMIQRETDLKEYYRSAFSTFSLNEKKILHQEEKEFLDKVIKNIEQNIQNPELSVEFLSASMNYSTRQFYRKLKDVTEQSPSDIIKELRILSAEQLLLTSSLRIEEVMNSVGFNNRATFYKLFTAKYGMAPRQYREQKRAEAKENDNKR